MEMHLLKLCSVYIPVYYSTCSVLVLSPESERVSCQGTPLPPPRLGRDRGAREEKGRGSEREGGGEWHVEHSRPPTQLEGPFSPLMFQAPPTIPRIMELDISRKR